MNRSTRRFDGSLLFDALEGRRTEAGLTWSGVAGQVWDLSRDLNSTRPHDHPFSTSSITRLRDTGRIGCQHALLLVWWLGAAPEDFVLDAHPETRGVPLPLCPPDLRLRWHIAQLYRALDGHRTEEHLTWSRVAAQLGCRTSQVTGLRTARYATTMTVAMAVTQALRRPAAEFIHPAGW